MALRGGRYLLLGLAVLLIASLWRTVWVEREKRRVAASYEAAQQTLAQLQEERAQLMLELQQAQGTIEGQSGDLGQLHEQLEGLQGRLEDTVAELASLQRAHEQLRTQHTSLTAQLDSVTTEKRQLEARLSSIKELKLAIRDVKHKMWGERWVTWRARAEALKRADQERLAKGNRGYLVRDGVPTQELGTKLQVRVLEPEPQ